MGQGQAVGLVRVKTTIKVNAGVKGWNSKLGLRLRVIAEVGKDKLRRRYRGKD